MSTQRELVHVTLLGGLAVAVGGRQVRGAEWPTRRSAELVALLALSDQHRLVRDRVVDALWPHLDPRRPAPQRLGRPPRRRGPGGRREPVPADVATELTGSDVLLVDVREPAETAYGGIPGAVLVPRGLLEFGASRRTAATTPCRA